MKRRHIIGSLFGSLLSLTLFTKSAHAVEPWIERPLTLPSLHASADIGLGFGQHADGRNSNGDTSYAWGTGASIEAAVGLPILGEIGIRVAPRFGDGGKASRADAYGRLFDKQTFNQGFDTFANPEIFLRGTLVDVKVVAVGLETRFVLPFAENSDFGLMPGVPVRVRLPNLARIDTGLYFPIVTSDPVLWAVDLPAHLWFQAGDAFFGPLLGLRMQHIPGVSTPAGSTDSTNKTYIRAGFGGGYTVAGFVDLKAQIYAAQLNDLPSGTSFTNTIGIGLGAGINIP